MTEMTQEGLQQSSSLLCCSRLSAFILALRGARRWR
jgi:hypothetical protein